MSPHTGHMLWKKHYLQPLMWFDTAQKPFSSDQHFNANNAITFLLDANKYVSD